MINITDSECIICLHDDELETNNSILPIDKINELEKSCLCKYNVHKNCIQEWLIKNPTCVICNKPLYYIESSIHHEINEDNIQIVYNVEHIYNGHHNEENTAEEEHNNRQYNNDEDEDDDDGDDDDGDDDENDMEVDILYNANSSRCYCFTAIICFLIVIFIIIYNII